MYNHWVEVQCGIGYKLLNRFIFIVCWLITENVNIDESANALARYIAIHGATNYDMMVIFANPFGRVRKIWSHDMGLGPIGDHLFRCLRRSLGQVK